MSLLERVRATGLLPTGRDVLVLLSGGRDSVCLLAIAVRLGCDVRALHVNYGLRQGADGDERHCAELCRELGVDLDVHRAERLADASGNLQAWARDVRYGVAAASGRPIAVGHTATDQAETVLLRLAGSRGRRALIGMAPVNGRVLRPLLAAGATRDQTAAWCREHGLAWCEDPSNASDVFARARVRERLVPLLREVDPRAEANIVATAQLLREEAAVLDTVVETALAGRDRIALDSLARLPAALARLVVRRLAEEATGELCGRAPSRLDEILALGDGALDVGDGARAVVGDGVLRFERTPPLTVADDVGHGADAP